MNSLITKNNANPIAINDDNGVMEDIVSIVCNGSPKLGVNFSKSLSVFESANKILPKITAKIIRPVAVFEKLNFNSFIVRIKQTA